MVIAEGIGLLLNLLVYFRFMNEAYLTRTWVPIELPQVRLVLF